MAKKKNELLARVRYVNHGQPTGPRGETEGYAIETYDPEYGWCLDREYFFSKSAIWPEADDYVSADIVNHIFGLKHLDYHIHFCKAGEE